MCSFAKGKFRKNSNFDSIQNSLVPFFFTITKPKRNSSGEEKPLFGPFISLPNYLQKNSIELLYYFDQLNTNMKKALVAVSSCK
jgi:hypothetical protein